MDLSKYEVRFSPQVRGQLIQHTKFIANVSKPFAQRFYAEFSKIIKRLENNPYQFPFCDDPNLPQHIYHKALFSKWYKAVFSIENETVYIEAVVDGRTLEQNMTFEHSRSRTETEEYEYNEEEDEWER